jgi:hypothetical protein
VCNRGAAEAELHVLPTLWFRNTWAAWVAHRGAKPVLQRMDAAPGTVAIAATHPSLGIYYLYGDGDVPLLFTENETNNARLFPAFPNASPWVKDGINDFVVQGLPRAINPDQTGTKASPHFRLTIGGGQSATIRLRLTDRATLPFGSAFDETLAARRQEADAFYTSVIPGSASADEARVMRQALAGCSGASSTTTSTSTTG